jgi:cytochrome c oxidase cbb3-type subunit III
MRKLVLTLLTCGALTTGTAAELLQQSAPPPDPALVSQGEPLYQQLCGACHGGNGSGGPGGAVNLTQSSIAMATDGGRTLRAFLQVGRPDKGMPPMTVTEAQGAALSARLLSFRPAVIANASTPAQDPVLVGDATVGKAFFNGPIGKCNTCHAVENDQPSPATNLARIGSKYPDAKRLQNNMLLNRSFFWSPALGQDVTAVVTYQDGRKLTGFLSSVSDFKVIIRDQAGKETTLTRSNGEPSVVLTDRLQHHLDLLEVYRDADIHNLTAYLATLK